MLAVVVGSGVGAQPVAASLAQVLQERGETRARFVGERPGAEALAGTGFQQLLVDGQAGIEDALQGVEDLVLVPTLDENPIQRKLGVLEAAQLAGVKRVTLVSLIGARRESPIRLLSRFGTLEQEVKARGFEHSIVQSAPLMQALFLFARNVARTHRIEAPFRDAKLPWLDARDLGRAAGVIAVERAHRGRVFRMTGPASLNFADVAKRFSSALGEPIAYEDICMHQVRGCLEGAGVEPLRIQLLTEWWDALVSGLVEVHVSRDIRTATRIVPRGVDAFIADHKGRFLADPLG